MYIVLFKKIISSVINTKFRTPVLNTIHHFICECYSCFLFESSQVLADFVSLSRQIQVKYLEIGHGRLVPFIL
jgi:hypothetical protein